MRQLMGLAALGVFVLAAPHLFRTGFHLAGRADPASRVGLTLQQAMGLQVEKWGMQSMETNRTITELMA